jgi:NADH-quinone oxidoreductase subunit N
MIINILNLNSFSVYAEYFIGVTSLYVLIFLTLLIKNIPGLFILKVISEIFGIILLVSCFLICYENQYFLNIIGQPLTNVFNYNLDTHMLYDDVSAISKIFLCFFSFIFFNIVSDFILKSKLTFEFFILLFFAILGLLFICSSGDFILIFIAIELVSLISYAITGFRKNSVRSIEAGIKYLVVGALASSLFVLGTSFIYLFTGSFLVSDYIILFADLNTLFLKKTPSVFNIAHTYYLFTSNKTITNLFDVNNFFLIEIGLFLIFISIFIKLSLAPFHLWSLDVFEYAPTIATFFFSAITKISFIIFLFRITIAFAHSYYYIISNLCLTIGLTSIIIGSLSNLQQKKIKTFMAYSSINHMGFIILSLSVLKNLSIVSTMYYLVIYVLTNLLIWHIILNVLEIRNKYKLKNSLDFSDFLLMNNSNSILSLNLLIGFSSFSGLPPFVGFFAKFQILFLLIQIEYYLITLLIIICSVISTFYYIRIIKILYFENVLVGKLHKPITTNKILLCCLLSFSLILLLIKPGLLYLIVYYFVIRFYSELNIFYLL